jgi:hypothetical protein
MNWLERAYQKLWFATEFWLTPVNRRPYTFIMRDWIYTHITQAVILIVVFYIGMIILSLWHGTISTLLVAFGSALLAHLIWGSAWIENQQEVPEYLGE